MRVPIFKFVFGITLKTTWTEFVRRFNYFNERYSDIETHFKPQVSFFGLSKDNYTHVFDVSEMKQVKEFFEDTYKRNFPDLHLQQGGNKQKPTVTKEQESWIQDRYKEDYDAGWY